MDVLKNKHLLRLLAKQPSECAYSTSRGPTLAEIAADDLSLAASHYRKNRAYEEAVDSIFRRSWWRNWYSCVAPDSLAIFGTGDNDHGDAFSLLSCHCVVPGLKDIRPPRHQLTFFCGLHHAPDDPLNDTSGIMRSLISQLIYSLCLESKRYRFTATELEAIERHDVDTLIYVFKQFLYCCRGKQIDCMIDGISWYTKGQSSQEMDHMIQGLQDVVQYLSELNADAPPRPSIMPIATFKLVFTSPILPGQSTLDKFKPTTLFQSNLDAISEKLEQDRKDFDQRAEDVDTAYQQREEGKDLLADTVAKGDSFEEDSKEY